VTRSRQQLVRLSEQYIQRGKQAAAAPRVLWANLNETPAEFAKVIKREQAARTGLLLAVVPHGFALNLPPAPNLRRVELPPKLFRLFHPAYPSRYRAAYGGRGSAKSWTIARALILRTLVTPERWLCAREYQKSIAESAHRLLSDQVAALGLDRYFTITNQTIVSHTGAEFIFEGLFANVSKIKSLEGLDGCWVEEAAKVSKNSWEVLAPTVRKPGSEVWVNFNPEDEKDPTYERFVISPSPDASVLHVTYADNPWFPQELEKERAYLERVDPDAHAHIWMGCCRTHSDSQIFKGKISVQEFTPPTLPENPTPEQRVNYVPWHGPYQGADWGFAKDPSTLVRCWVSADKRTLYIEYESYGIGVDTDKLAAMFARDIPDAARHRTRGDNARPETISYLRQHGFPELEGVTKRPGSVEDGVAFIRQFEQIVIHPRCTHAIEEGRLYSYKIDRLTGLVKADIEDRHNHIWDAVRYALEPMISSAVHGMFAFMQEQIAKLSEPEQTRDKRDAPGVTVTPLTWQ
jgi:phage terminase large subunit